MALKIKKITEEQFKEIYEHNSYGVVVESLWPKLFEQHELAGYGVYSVRAYRSVNGTPYLFYNMYNSCE